MKKAVFCGKEIKGVIFDLDGTLIHSTVDFTIMKQRMIRSLAARGIPSSLLDARHTTLENMEAAIAHLVAKGRVDEASGIRAMVGRMMSDTELERVHETRAIEGADDCISILRQAGLSLGLLTRGSRAYALAALRYGGLTKPFDAMICRDDFPEEEAKPNGKAMVRMATLLGLSSEECLLVGDHSMDQRCACSAGAPFVGVLTGAFGPTEWSQNGCPLTIKSVSELPNILLSQDH